MNRTGPVALTLGALLLLLASCSGEDAGAEPRPTATSASPSATTAAPSEPAPTMPAQANAPFPEGAPAFTKYYVDVLNHAARTGETVKLRSLSAPACKGCASYADSFDANAEKGRFLTGQLWQMGPEIELEAVGRQDLAVIASIRTLNDDQTRTSERLVFVISGSQPRQVLDLYGLEN